MRTLYRILEAGRIHYYEALLSHGFSDGTYMETGHLDDTHTIRLLAGKIQATVGLHEKSVDGDGSRCRELLLRLYTTVQTSKPSEICLQTKIESFKFLFFFANKVTSNALTMVMSKGVGLFSAQVFLFEERSIHAFVLWANWVPSIVYSMESIVYFSYSFSDLQIFLDGHDKFWITFVDVTEKVCCLLPARR